MIPTNKLVKVTVTVFCVKLLYCKFEVVLKFIYMSVIYF